MGPSRLSLLVIISVLLSIQCSSSNNTNILKPPATLSSVRNQTLVSVFFELGFFNLGKHNSYLGIWYRNLPGERIYVWVANRDTPLRGSDGVLEISGGKLSLRDNFDNATIWEAEQSLERASVVAELLDSGNLVLRSSNNDVLWQSFDFPTDTLLPGMKLRSVEGPSYSTDKYIACWRDVDNPAKGRFAFGVQGSKFFRLLVFDGDKQIYRSGAWNDVSFMGIPLVFKTTGEAGVFVYEPNTDAYSRVVINNKGVLQSLRYDQMSLTWDREWLAPENLCDRYNHCGANSYCTMETHKRTSKCLCLRGFEPVESRCIMKRTAASCHTSSFYLLRNMKWPDTAGSSTNRFPIKSLESCKERCEEDCGCKALTIFKYSNGSYGRECVTWQGDLLDLRNYSAGLGGQDLFLKIEGRKKKENKIGIILGLSLGLLALILVCVAAFCYWKRKQNRAREAAASTGIGLETNQTMLPPRIANTLRTFPPMEFRAIVHATNNFSEQIGEGGFGKVYKGRLANGQDIAVKKLSAISNQGATEFENEIESIARLQHVNIVRLHGWCVYGTEKLLAYEYMPNGSLDQHLFDGELNWASRFKIIKGVAKGMEYIKDGDRNMIIHRDLKPSNILLDYDFTPKISDFGLARICVRNEKEGVTKHTAGTRYMSPEYVIRGIYSAELDIYSYGVTLLEIVTGVRHKPVSSMVTNIIMDVWVNRLEKKFDEILDKRISRDSLLPWDEVTRSIDVGLLCVQTKPGDRPKMSHVVAMLEDQSIEIPEPKRPDFTVIEEQDEVPSSSSNTITTTNLFTVTKVQGR